MMQYGIRSLFVVIFASAIFFAVARTAGCVVAAGTIVATSALVSAVFWRRGGAILYLRIGSAIFASTALWLLAVDWSWFVVDCSDCYYGRDIGQYRIFGIPIHSQVHDAPTYLQLVLKDLGVPCEHDNLESWHKHRHRITVCGVRGRRYPR